MTITESKTLAYIIGCSLGDGNLSSPNKRVTRLRITCDSKYPRIIREITNSLESLLPHNKVSLVQRKDNCVDVSVYSKRLDEWMPWEVGQGSKIHQNPSIPSWIAVNSEYAKFCLRGLIQTDGCIYTDRGYQMVNFVSNAEQLALDVFSLLKSLSFNPKLNTFLRPRGAPKYTVKIAKQEEVEALLEHLGLRDHKQ